MSIPAILLLFAFAVLPVSAQQQTPIVCLVYTIQDLSPAGSDTGAYEQTITDAVSAAAAAQGYTLVAASAWRDAAAASQSLDPSRFLTQTPALAVARAVGADVAVTGSFVVQDDQIYYSIQCWDVTAGSLAGGIQETTPFNLAFFTALNQKLTTSLFPSVQLGRKESPRLVFTSPDEGMDVLLAGDMDIGQITDGRVSWPVAGLSPGTKIVVEKRKPGFHTDRQTVVLVTGKDIPLTPLTPEHTRSVEVDETIGQLLGVSAAIRGYSVPDWFYGYLGSSLWVQPPVTFAPRVAYHYDNNFGFGGYLFFPPGSWFRVGIETGLGYVLTLPSTPGFPLYTDIYADVARISLEVDLARVAFFLRTDFVYALGVGTNTLLGRGWLLNTGPQVTIGVLLR